MGSPRVTKIDLVTFDVLFEGKELPPHLNIRSINVKLGTKAIPEATIIIVNGSDQSITHFDFLDESFFVPGGEVEIKVGYHLDNQLIFKGTITKKGVKIKGTNSFEMTLNCKDEAYKMTKSRMSSTFENVTDTGMIEEVIKKAGGSIGDVDGSSFSHETNLQNQSTDWDFIVSRAETAGRTVVVENGKINIEAIGKRSNGIVLTLGVDIKSVNLNLDTTNHAKKVVASAWDHEKQEFVSEEFATQVYDQYSHFKSGVDTDRVVQVQSTTKMETGYLKQWAEARMIKLELARLKGSVSFQGTTDAVPNSYLMLTGFGEDLNGKAYISSVSHDIGGGEWTTQCEIGEDAEEFASSASNVSSAGASGLAPSMQGSYTAKVVQTHDDPKGNNRILIDIPSISKAADKADGSSDDKGQIWARMSNQYASGDVGSFFLPEVDDEVLVSFLQNDPRHPIITGMTHSQVNSSPYQPDADNTYKAIVTKSKMKIEFEDVKKIITISTPSGNIITISEDEKFITIVDENDNKVELKPEGINIQSPKDITIKADGKIEIEAMKTIDIKGMKDVSIESSSANVDVKATQALSAEGSMSAELKSNGITTVKGTMVKIN